MAFELWRVEDTSQDKTEVFFDLVSVEDTSHEKNAKRSSIW